MTVTASIPIPRSKLARRIEWPTLVAAAVIYGGFGLLTWFYEALPWWLVLPLGGYLVAWQGSLQHEVVHGHPTPWRWVNEALVFPSLWLWLPYSLYRDSHLVHHQDENLTDPYNDPESNYLSPETWAVLGPIQRGMHWWLKTVSGRLMLGPVRCVGTFFAGEIRRLVRGDTGHLGVWAVHAGACAVVLVWVMWVCEIPFVAYVALFAYPGTSLTLLRSFLEHQAREDVSQRTVVVEAGPVMSLLYLNNNLHTLHHAEPGLAWYRLPARYRAERARLLERNCGCLFRGYGEVLARYLFWPKETPVHPFAGRPSTVQVAAIQEPAAPFSAEPAT